MDGMDGMDEMDGQEARMTVPESFDASVVVLTANRLAQLRRLLRALEAQSVAPREILVVDNGSSDGTGRWLRDAAPPLVRAIEGKRDVDFAEARNRAVAEARGEWVIFIDDDCAPCPGWLQRARELSAACDLFGGPVLAMGALPGFDGFDPEMAWAVGLSTPGAFSSEAGYSVLPQTANLAVRRRVLMEHPFQSAGGETFDSAELDKYASGREDAEIWQRLRILGYRACFDSRFVVLHDIPRERVNPDYILQRMRQDARAAAVRAQPPRFVEEAINEVAVGFVSRRASLAERFWRERQREYLRACVALGEPGLAPGEVMKRLAKACVAQTGARIKRTIRRAFAWRGKRRLPEPAKLRRIVVATQGYIGDMVILAPVLCWLKRNLPPEAELILIATERTRELYHGFTANDPQFAICDTPSRARERADIVFVPYWHNAPPAALFRTGAPVATFDREVGFLRQWWYDRADVAVAKDFAVNELVNLTRLFAPLGIEGPPPPIKWPRDEAAAAQADSLLKEFSLAGGEPVIGIHFGATHPGKAWPIERWGELIKRLAASYPSCRFALTGARDEAPVAESLIRGHSLRAANLCGRDDLRVFPELARRMRLFISTDSGPRHLAAAVGCPTVALYGWTDPRRWGAFYDPEKHSAICAGDPILTPEELRGQSDLAVRRISVNHVFEVASGILTGRFAIPA